LSLHITLEAAVAVQVLLEETQRSFHLALQAAVTGGVELRRPYQELLLLVLAAVAVLNGLMLNQAQAEPAAQGEGETLETQRLPEALYLAVAVAVAQISTTALQAALVL
jgi:hypothetical protein